MSDVPHPEATHLSHSDACLGDSGTRDLCASLVLHANLTSLDLRGCQIHAAGAAALAALLQHRDAPPLATLSLEWNSIGTTDAGPKALAAALAQSLSLTSLDLRNNHLGPTAVAAIADGISRSAALRSIDLRWNAAGASGGLALEEALCGNHTMLRVQLSGNRVPPECLGRIEAHLARNGGINTAIARFARPGVGGGSGGGGGGGGSGGGSLGAVGCWALAQRGLRRRGRGVRKRQAAVRLALGAPRASRAPRAP